MTEPQTVDADETIVATSTASAPTDNPTPAAIRAWAVANGREVGTRGRISTELREAYAAAH